MNTTKFVVVLVIGVVCANVGARQLEGVSKETKFGIPLPRTASINGIRAELDSYGSTYQANSNHGTTSANNGLNGASANGTGSDFTSTDGYINATGPNTALEATSGGAGQGQAVSEAGPGGSSSVTGSSGGGSSFVTGSSEPLA